MKSRKPYSFLSLIAFLFVGPILTFAQNAEMQRHFDYDRTAPLNIKQIGVQRRANATIYDITYDSPKGGVVPAYLVVPKGRGPFAAVIWGHWYGKTLRCAIGRSFSMKRLPWRRRASCLCCPMGRLTAPVM